MSLNEIKQGVMRGNFTTSELQSLIRGLDLFKNVFNESLISVANNWIL